MCRQELAAAIVSEGLRPLMDPRTPPPLAQLLEDCWNLASSRRPTAAQLVQRLAAIVGGGALKDGVEATRRGPSTQEREAARRAVPNGRGKAARKPWGGPLEAPAWLGASDSGMDQAQQVSVSGLILRKSLYESPCIAWQ